MATHHWTTLLFTVVALAIPASAHVHMNLVRHFLLENNIKTVLFLSCQSAEDLRHLLKDAHTIRVWTASVPIGGSSAVGLDYERFFWYHNHRMAVVTDLECPTIRVVLDEVSKRSYFHQRYFWLIFADSATQSLALLGGENINVDAEITVALPAAGSRKYDLWDVYKHSHLRGGPLNMTFKYHWDEYILQKKLIVESKYRRRINFHGLTLKGVLTVIGINDLCCIFTTTIVSFYMYRSLTSRRTTHYKRTWTAPTLPIWTA